MRISRTRARNLARFRDAAAAARANGWLFSLIYHDPSDCLYLRWTDDAGRHDLLRLSRPTPKEMAEFVGE